MKTLFWDARRQELRINDGSYQRRYTLAEVEVIYGALDKMLETITRDSASDHEHEIRLPSKGTIGYVQAEVGSKELELLTELMGGSMQLQGLQDNGYTRSLLKLEALGYVTTYPVRGDAIGSRDVVITPEGTTFLKKHERTAAT